MIAASRVAAVGATCNGGEKEEGASGWISPGFHEQRVRRGSGRQSSFRRCQINVTRTHDHEPDPTLVPSLVDFPDAMGHDYVRSFPIGSRKLSVSINVATHGIYRVSRNLRREIP